MAEGAAALLQDDALAEFMAQREDEQIFDLMLSLSGLTGDYHYLSGNCRTTADCRSLDDDAIVELPATVGHDRLELLRPVADVPKYFRIWLGIQSAIHDRSVDAALNCSRAAAIEAILLDPVFRGSDCSPQELAGRDARSKCGSWSRRCTDISVGPRNVKRRCPSSEGCFPFRR